MMMKYNILFLYKYSPSVGTTVPSYHQLLPGHVDYEPGLLHPAGEVRAIVTVLLASLEVEVLIRGGNRIDGDVMNVLSCHGKAFLCLVGEVSKARHRNEIVPLLNPLDVIPTRSLRQNGRG